MIAKTKWFSKEMGYGFLITDDEKEFFVHQSSIRMDGFRHLNKDDIVNFDIGMGNNGREQAINVHPFLTRKMISDELKEENLHVEVTKDADNIIKYFVVDENNALQTSEQGINFLELAAFTGFDIEGLSV